MACDTHELVAAYWKYSRTKADDLSWAWDEVEANGWHDPETKWPLILALLIGATDARQIGLVGSGPLESLITLHGKDFIDRIETEAQTNSRLRDALAGVWIRGSLRPDPDVIADRVDRIVAGSAR
jgi:hypothetical protein